MVVRGLMRVAPAQRFQCAAVVFGQPDQRVVKRQPRDIGAGFGGGGASGKRSLEGTFLSGCILTARKTAMSIRAKR